MNAVEILGSLLSGKKSGSVGGAILKDILAGALKQRGGGAPQQQQPQHEHRGQHRGIEDIIQDSHSQYQNRQGIPQDCKDPSHTNFSTSAASELDNEQAVVLIRAMVNAAKADGRLDQQEKDAILSRLGDVTNEEVEFLKGEFARPLDVRELDQGLRRARRAGRLSLGAAVEAAS